MPITKGQKCIGDPSSDSIIPTPFSQEALRLAGFPSQGIKIWGAGSLGRVASRHLRATGILIRAFIDSDTSKHGKELDGLRISSPSHLDPCDDYVLIASQYADEIEQELRALGFVPEVNFKRFTEGLTTLFTPSILYSLYRIWTDNLLLNYTQIDKSQVRCCGGYSPSLNETSARAGDKTFVINVGDCSFDTTEIRLYVLKTSEIQAPDQQNINNLVFSAHGNYDDLVKRAFSPLSLPVSVSNETFGTKNVDLLGSRVEQDGNPIIKSFPGYIIQVGVDSTQQAEKLANEVNLTSHPTFAQPSLELLFLKKMFESGVNPITEALAAWWYRTGAASIADDAVAFQATETENIESPNAKRRKFALATHSRGNFFFSELNQYLNRIISEEGYQVVSIDENGPFDLADYELIIIAPHEFFTMGTLFDFEANQNNYSLITTEQIHTNWFSSSIPMLSGAKTIMDLNEHTASFMRHIGLNAVHLPLGGTLSISSSSEAASPLTGAEGAAWSLWKNRPIDVLFVGGLTSRREKFFSENSSFFSKYNCYIHIPRVDSALSKDNPDLLTQLDVAALATRAKIVLALHRDAVAYFEWHRIVSQGLAYGALVVTEDCLLPYGLESGSHLVATDLNLIPALCDYYLHSGASIAATIARNGYDYFRRELTPKKTIASILTAIKMR